MVDDSGDVPPQTDEDKFLQMDVRQKSVKVGSLSMKGNNVCVYVLFFVFIVVYV